MQLSTEISIDLTAQELLEPPALTGMVEVDDIGDVDPMLRTGSFVANSATPQPAATTIDDLDDAVEIELSADQMDILLGDPGIR